MRPYTRYFIRRESALTQTTTEEFRYYLLLSVTLLNIGLLEVQIDHQISETTASEAEENRPENESCKRWGG